MSFQVQVGASKYPDNECLGVSESYFRLLQACGHEKTGDDISISPSQFVGHRAIFGIDFERAGNEAPFSGISTTDGKVMTLHVKNSQVTPADPHMAFVYHVYDNIVNIRQAPVGVSE